MAQKMIIAFPSSMPRSPLLTIHIARDNSYHLTTWSQIGVICSPRVTSPTQLAPCSLFLPRLPLATIINFVNYQALDVSWRNQIVTSRRRLEHQLKPAPSGADDKRREALELRQSLWNVLLDVGATAETTNRAFLPLARTVLLFRNRLFLLILFLQ